MANKKQNTVPLPFDGRIFHVAPDFSLVRQIERELGGIAALQESFARQDWFIADLVTLVHMMLQSAGETLDYVLLGNRMLREGLVQYHNAAQVFLNMVLHAE